MPFDSGNQRQHALAPFRTQIATCGTPVIAGGKSNVEHLQHGTQSVLAGGLQQINEVVALIQEVIMKMEQHLGSLLDWPGGPFLLCSVSYLCADLDIGWR